jgi:hypothetical protein
MKVQTIPTQTEPRRSKEQPYLIPFYKSYFCLSLVLFAAINVALWVVGGSFNRFENLSAPWAPNKSRTWWSLKEFESKQRGDIVLMGSSLMMCASGCADSNAFKSIESRTWAHPCNYLIAKLKALTGRVTDNFCFALPGQTPSDAWCIAKTTFVNERMPKVLIYGISPADCLNCTFLGPSHTNTFKLMHQVGDCSDVEFEDLRNPWERLDYEIEHRFWLYRHRSDVLFFHRNLTDFVIGDVFHQDLTRSNLSPALRKMFYVSKPEEFFANDPLLLNDDQPKQSARSTQIVQQKSISPIARAFKSPLLPKMATRSLSQSINPAAPTTSLEAEQEETILKLTGRTREYLIGNPLLKESLGRYWFMFHRINERSYREQILCLTRLARYCQSHGISLFIVNMPVCIEHFRLIPPQNYQRFSNDVQAIARSTKSEYLDLYDPTVFPTTVFIDSNHLNGTGAVRFWDMLVPRIAQKISLALHPEEDSARSHLVPRQSLDVAAHVNGGSISKIVNQPF